MRRARARDRAVFQDPLTSLNPLYTVGRQLAETIVTHLPLSWSQARERAIELLAATGIPAARERIDHFAPVLRRHAPARGDRAGAGGRTQAGGTDEPPRRWTSPSRRRSSNC